MQAITRRYRKHMQIQNHCKCTRLNWVDFTVTAIFEVLFLYWRAWPVPVNAIQWMYLQLIVCLHPSSFLPSIPHPTFLYHCFDRCHAAGGTEAGGTFQHWICHGAYWCQDFRGHHEYAREQCPGLLQGMSIRFIPIRHKVTPQTGCWSPSWSKTEREAFFKSYRAVSKVCSTTRANYFQL